MRIDFSIGTTPVTILETPRFWGMLLKKLRTEHEDYISNDRFEEWLFEEWLLAAYGIEFIRGKNPEAVVGGVNGVEIPDESMTFLILKYQLG